MNELMIHACVYPFVPKGVVCESIADHRDGLSEIGRLVLLLMLHGY